MRYAKEVSDSHAQSMIAAPSEVGYQERDEVERPKLRRAAGSTPGTCATNSPFRRSSASELHLYLSLSPAL